MSTSWDKTDQPFGLPTPALLLSIFAAALISREAVTFIFADLNKVFEYQLIAANLVQGKGISWNEWGRLPLQPTSLFPPLYVYWCAVFIYLFGQNFLPMFMAQAVISASACIPAYLVGKRMFSERVGLLFALAYALYPEMMYVHSRGTPEFLYVVICLWLFWFYLRLLQSDPSQRSFFVDAVSMGFLTGIGLMVREGVSIVTGAAMLSLLAHKKPFWFMVRRGVLPVAAVTMIALVPWTVRNWMVLHRFIPLRTAYGLNLWMGNHAEATGTDKTMSGDYQMNLLWAKNKDYYAKVIPNDEYERNQFYAHEALAYVRNHPGDYLRLTAKRLWYFVWFDPTHPLAKSKIYRASYVLLLIFGVSGIVRAMRRHNMDTAIVFTFLGFLALYVPVIVLPRYRIIPVLLLLLLASYAVNELWSWWGRRRAAL